MSKKFPVSFSAIIKDPNSFKLPIVKTTTCTNYWLQQKMRHHFHDLNNASNQRKLFTATAGFVTHYFRIGIFTLLVYNCK